MHNYNNNYCILFINHSYLFSNCYFHLLIISKRIFFLLNLLLEKDNFSVDRMARQMHPIIDQ